MVLTSVEPKILPWDCWEGRAEEFIHVCDLDILGCGVHVCSETIRCLANAPYNFKW